MVTIENLSILKQLLFSRKFSNLGENFKNFESVDEKPTDQTVTQN